MEESAGNSHAKTGFEGGITRQTINIKEVIRSKNERLAKVLPEFVYRYIRRIIHEREINEFLYENREKRGLDFVKAVIDLFELKIIVNGLEHIPPSGKVTLVSNHPLGGLDGMTIFHVIGKVRQDIVSPVNDLLLFLPNTRNLFVPINKHGKNTDNIKILNEAFAGENIMPIFPAGLCSRKQKGVVCDLEWKTTFITKSKKHKRLVVPMHFSGKNSNFFYRIANIRKFLGIKANIEMFFLVNEMFKQFKKEFVITIGEPIDPSFFDNSKKPREWASWMKKRVYELGDYGR